MPRFFVRETFTPDNPDADRLRVEAVFATEPGDHWEMLLAAVAAIHGDGGLAEECDRGDVIPDGIDRFHAHCWTNSGEYQWWVYPLAERPAPVANCVEAEVLQRTLFS